MAHIPVAKNAPGIVGLLQAYPDTGKHLSNLAQALLRGPSSLTPGERELIAAFVSSGNGCYYCANSHAAVARELLGESQKLVDTALKDPSDKTISDKMQALLAIADKVRKDARGVDEQDIKSARTAGADDQAIHHTVLIAAAFCMYNRYVDGLATTAPREVAVYAEIGKRLATQGYQLP